MLEHSETIRRELWSHVFGLHKFPQNQEVVGLCPVSCDTALGPPNRSGDRSNRVLSRAERVK